MWLDDGEKICFSRLLKEQFDRREQGDSSLVE